ncbi:MAG: hypothetical protein V7K68_17150 [Nostoc sp.]|uniref:hypothetical protein n=1 Tax=Nostoc sp. TaxID=1180 RepID=UPI002FF7F53B
MSKRKSLQAVQNVKTEIATGKAEAVTGYAKHGNVKAEVATGKTEAVTGKTEAVTSCAKHGNVKAEVATGWVKRIYHSQALEKQEEKCLLKRLLIIVTIVKTQ